MRNFAFAVLMTGGLIAGHSLASAQMTPQQYHKQVGACACPDDKDRAGKRCGKRSAFCRQDGAEVQCYRVNVERRRKKACG